ncbi:hypothetical protein [Romboutsia timonensis]|nr:hypothetical protein [Romboutsia timonensis]MDY3959614.1 hypothetical protein [Romboutsia timonensis]
MIQIAILIAEIILMILKEGISIENATSEVSKANGIDYVSLYNKIPNEYK